MSATIKFVDSHKATSEITLSFDPPEVSQEAGPTEVTVTATINGETLIRRDTLTFPLIVVGESTGGVGCLHLSDVQADVPPMFQRNLTEAIEHATRDTDYKITGLGNLSISRKKVSGKATFVIDPSKRSPLGRDRDNLWP